MSFCHRNGGRVDPLTAAHHTGVYQQHLCRLLEIVVEPLTCGLQINAAGAAVREGQLAELCRDLQAAPPPRPYASTSAHVGTLPRLNLSLSLPCLGLSLSVCACLSLCVPLLWSH